MKQILRIWVCGTTAKSYILEAILSLPDRKLPIQYEPVWTSMNQYEPVWTCMNLYEPTWTNMNQYEPVSTSINQYEPVSTSINQYQPVWTSINQYEPVWTSKCGVLVCWYNHKLVQSINYLLCSQSMKLGPVKRFVYSNILVDVRHCLLFIFSKCWLM